MGKPGINCTWIVEALLQSRTAHYFNTSVPTGMKAGAAAEMKTECACVHAYVRVCLCVK